MPFPPSGYDKDKQLKTRFGITLEDYNKMLSIQNNSCKMCGLHEDDHASSLHVDHNHETGRVRGVLCTNCNTGLGQIKDNINTLNSMINYVRFWKKPESRWEWLSDISPRHKMSFWEEGDMKKCSGCNEWKRIDVWFKTTNRSDRNYRQYRPYCRSCNSAELRKRDLKKRGKIPPHADNGVRRVKFTDSEKLRASKDNYYYGAYKILYQDFMKILEIQNKLCFICATDNPGSRMNTLAVDHCHETKKVRGLLCHHCNTGLGLLVSTNNIRSAIEYLKEK